MSGIPGGFQSDSPQDALSRLSQIKGISCEQRDLLRAILEELRAIRQLLEKRSD